MKTGQGGADGPSALVACLGLEVELALAQSDGATILKMKMALCSMLLLATTASLGCSKKKAAGPGAFCAEEFFSSPYITDAFSSVACYRTVSACLEARTRVELSDASDCYLQPEFWCQAVGESDTYGCYIDENDCLRSFEHREKRLGVASSGECSRHTSFPGEPKESEPAPSAGDNSGTP